MPKKDKEEEDISVNENEEKTKDKKKKKKSGKKNKDVLSTPVKNKKITKQKKKEIEEEEVEDDDKEQKKKKVDVKKVLKQVKKEIISLGKKVNKRAYRKHFEQEARDPKAYKEIVDNIDILIKQSDTFDELTKRKPSYRYIKQAVVKFINKNPISNDQPKFKSKDDSGMIVGNKITISKVLHAYLKKNCECIKKEGQSRSAFSCISYKLDKTMKELLTPIYKETNEEVPNPLSFSGVSGVVSRCQYNKVNVLKQDIEAFKEINDWFANYEPVKPKGEPKKRGRKPKSEEEKEKTKKEKEKDKEENKKKKEVVKDKKKKKKDDETE